MSANLDLVRSISADWERGDFRRVEWADPTSNGCWSKDLHQAHGTVWSGWPKGFRESMSAWQDARVRAEELRELDDEQVLVLAGFGGRGKASGIPLPNVKVAHVFHVREGKITRFVAYWDRDRAPTDLGLAPEDDAA
jgi:ketosteroid isomerase-like protein